VSRAAEIASTHDIARTHDIAIGFGAPSHRAAQVTGAARPSPAGRVTAMTAPDDDESLSAYTHNAQGSVGAVMPEQYGATGLGGKGGMHADAFVSPYFMKHLLATRPPVIYHYTTQRGLLGIIENRELWATNILYMNDSTEFSIVFQLVGDILATYKTTAHPIQHTLI
jgi:hypothetical protein